MASTFTTLDQLGNWMGLELDNLVAGAASGSLKRARKVGRYYGLIGATADATDTPIQNTVQYHPFPVYDAFNIDRVALGVQSAGGASSVVRLGLYSSDTDGLPNTRVADFGAGINGTSATYQEITVSQSLTANTLYWMAAVWQVGTVGVLRAIGAGNGSEWVPMDTNARDPRSASMTEAGVSGALPATATPATLANATAPWAIRVRVA